MKILFAVPYIYEKNYSEFTRNKTGFGMMVNDIFKSVSQYDEVYLYSHVFTQGHGGILSHTKNETLRSVKIRDIGEAIRWFFQYQQSIKNRIKYSAYCINKGLLRKYINKLKPDIIHIHGIGMQTKCFIEVCEELRVPYTVTLHGLIGLNDSVSAPNWDKKLEREFLLESYKKNIPVTVISSGMKKRIENEYLHDNATNIRVITNGTDIPKTVNVSDFSIREKYGLSDDKKIAVVIGSLCKRKNQIQIVDAIADIPVEQRSKLVVLMCGVDLTEGKIFKHIEELNISDSIKLLGFVSHEDLDKIYELADFNIVASKDEGFGLSIIEAFMYGIPTVTFGDLDAIPNLYDKNAMVVCSNRTTEDLAKGITEIMSKSWDKRWICEYAREFSLENMAKKYEEEYEQILKMGGVMPLPKTIDYIKCERMLNRKILVYLGNITANKNQKELVSAMKNLDENYIALFLGRECDKGEVRELCISNGLEKKCIIAGFCDEVPSVLEYCSLNILLSKNEGFGLSIIESATYGVPSIMFSDLDAAEDLCVGGIASPIAVRENKVVIQKIQDCIKGGCGKQQLKKEVQRFSMDNIGKKYSLWYRTINHLKGDN